MERTSIIGVKNPSYRHGFATRVGGKIKEYHIWIMIRQRIYNPNNVDYHNYGGRGIKMCERWNSFKNFIYDMGYAPSPKHSVDRIKNDGNYEPGNCRWATNTEQANNRSGNILITIDGQTKTLAQWSKLKNIKYAIIYNRYKSNWPTADLFKPKTR